MFTDHMVLQQAGVVPIWGTADEGENVTVRCQGQSVHTQAKNGRWLVHLVNLRAGGPFEVVIQGKNAVRLQDVLVGEVWVCSGQSNMEWPMTLTANAKEAIAAANYPQIRLFHVRNTASPTPLTEVPGGPWKACTPETVKNFTAVGYFFGRDLHLARKVPVGLIQTAWGGTPAEAWTDQRTLTNTPQLAHLWQLYSLAVKSYPTRLAQWEEQMKKFKEERTKEEQAAKEAQAKSPPATQTSTTDKSPTAAKPPEKKQPPQRPGDPSRSPFSSATLYNGMIAPVAPYAIKGAIWYQGESNAGRAYEYRTLFPAMIQCWRKTWKQGDFPFLCVQLAPFDRVPQQTWPELREAQLYATQVLPQVGMAVITDVGDAADIHPQKKEPVGARLALAARAIAYGEKLVFSGPQYDSMRVEGNKVHLRFKHVGGGLVAKEGPLTGFTICSKDRKFVKAEAEIQGEEVVVWSKEVNEPVAVRFGWANYPVVNLWNKDGLPASPFRTDDFPGLTWPKARAEKK
jgi:sialate O-acetylesterase